MTCAPLAEQLGIVWPSGLREDPATWFANVAKEMRRVCGEVAVDRMLNEHAAQDSVLYRDHRLIPAALGQARSVTKLASEFGDAEHMGLSLQHREEIDLLQLDGRQHKPMLRNPRHVLQAQGLAHRSFAAADLPTAIQEVERLVGLLPKTNRPMCAPSNLQPNRQPPILSFDHGAKRLEEQRQQCPKDQSTTKSLRIRRTTVVLRWSLSSRAAS